MRRRKALPCRHSSSRSVGELSGSAARCQTAASVWDQATRQQSHLDRSNLPPHWTYRAPARAAPRRPSQHTVSAIARTSVRSGWVEPEVAIWTEDPLRSGRGPVGSRRRPDGHPRLCGPRGARGCPPPPRAGPGGRATSSTPIRSRCRRSRTRPPSRPRSAAPPEPPSCFDGPGDTIRTTRRPDSTSRRCERRTAPALQLPTALEIAAVLNTASAGLAVPSRLVSPYPSCTVPGSVPSA
jgi:hypothetical protein